MPFLVKKVGDKWKLWNIHKKIYTKVNFKSKETALKAGINYMKFRKEKPYVKGNRILKKK